MKKLKFNRENTKLVVGWVVGFGAGAVVKTLIENNVVGSSLHSKVGVKVGAWALSGLTVKASKEYTADIIDQAFDFYEKFKADQQ